MDLTHRSRINESFEFRSSFSNIFIYCFPPCSHILPRSRYDLIIHLKSNNHHCTYAAARAMSACVVRELCGPRDQYWSRSLTASIHIQTTFLQHRPTRLPSRSGPLHPRSPLPLCLSLSYIRQPTLLSSTLYLFTIIFHRIDEKEE